MNDYNEQTPNKSILTSSFESAENLFINDTILTNSSSSSSSSSNSQEVFEEFFSNLKTQLFEEPSFEFKITILLVITLFLLLLLILIFWKIFKNSIDNFYQNQGFHYYNILKNYYL